MKNYFIVAWYWRILLTKSPKYDSFYDQFENVNVVSAVCESSSKICVATTNRCECKFVLKYIYLDQSCCKVVAITNTAAYEWKMDEQSHGNIWHAIAAALNKSNNNSIKEGKKNQPTRPMRWENWLFNTCTIAYVAYIERLTCLLIHRFKTSQKKREFEIVRMREREKMKEREDMRDIGIQQTMHSVHD